MKTPRDLTGADLIKLLKKFGYQITRQTGSHIRLSKLDGKTRHHITVPNHAPIKIGTLSSILNEVSIQLKTSKEEILKLL